MIVINNDEKGYNSLGQQVLGGIPYDIVELPNIQYVCGFLTKYIFVPSKSLSKETPPNIE